MIDNFEQLIDQYGALISRVASSYEANEHLRQELTQEMLLAIWQSLKHFKGHSSFKTYILRIAHNKAVSHIAYQVKRKSTSDEHLTNLAYSTTLEEHSDQQQQINRLLHAIRALPVQPRQVITLAMEGLSYKDIGQVCGLDINHVGVIIKRAREQLAKVLENENR